MTQSMSWPDSGTPSRLALMRSTAAGTSPSPAADGTGRAASVIGPPALGQVGAGERRGQQPGQLGRPGCGVHQQAGPARLYQQLAAAPARQQRLAVAADHGDRGQGAATGGMQGGDETAFGAEGEPVGGVLDVT